MPPPRSASSSSAYVCSTYCEITSTAVPGTRRRTSSAARRPSSRKSGRQADVDDGEVGLLRHDLADQRLAVGDGRHDLDPVVAQQTGEAVAQQREVLGDHYAHGSSAWTSWVLRAG